jgi:hypothetical protein
MAAPDYADHRVPPDGAGFVTVNLAAFKIDCTFTNWLVPPPPLSDSFPNSDYFPNDLGDFADSIVMADAIRRSDHTSFAVGIKRFYGATPSGWSSPEVIPR